MLRAEVMKTKRKIKIVIIEDDHYQNKVLKKYISTICNSYVNPELDFEIKSFDDAHEAIQGIEDDLDIMILDYYLKNSEDSDLLTGEDILVEVKNHAPDCKVIMISNLQDSGKAIHLMNQGLYDYIDKNINTNNRLGAILEKALKEELIKK